MPDANGSHFTEAQGIVLANDSVARLRASGLSVPLLGPVPEGPHFFYEDGPELFLRRRGRGALHVTWDTNLLIDYFQFGGALWRGDSLADLIPNEHGLELEALQLIVSLWVLRDIRFHISPQVIVDSKRGNLSGLRSKQRERAWQEFCLAIALVGDDDDFRGETLILPASELERALKVVPAGNDRNLVGDAVRNRMHVFLTRDAHVLRAAEALRPFGLRIESPQELLEVLAASGAFHCMMAARHLYWPMPDQQRVYHLLKALPDETTNPDFEPVPRESSGH